MMNTTSYDYEAAKAEYRAFCDAGKHDIQLFALPWYLDAACESPDDWQVILVKSGEQIIAAFPFQYKRIRHGFLQIDNPWMAPRLGIWIDYQDCESPSSRYSLEDKVVESVIAKLPPFDIFNIHFDGRFQNWQKFYEAGFQQTTYYSYVLAHDRLQPEALLSIFESNKRRAVNKAMRENVRIRSLSAAEYWDFWEQSYKKRSREIACDKQQYERLTAAIVQHGCHYIKAAYNGDGDVICLLFVFYDAKRCYEIFMSYMPDMKPSSRPLLTYDAMRFAWENGCDYDFEGSMIPSVANYYSDFNAVKEPYYSISKYSSRAKLRRNARESFQLFGNMAKTVLKGKRNAT